MRKYWAVLKAYLATTFEYRTVPVTWALIELVTLTSGVFLWLAVYRDRTSVGEYDFHQMMFYYALIPLVGSITYVHVSSSLPKQIKDGRISIDLLKPYSLAAKTFMRSTGQLVLLQVLKFPIFLIAAGFVVHLFKIDLNIKNIGLALLICLFSYTLHFFIDLCLSYAAFWMDDVWALNHLKLVALSVFGGMIFPLGLIPQNLRFIFNFLPLRFIYFFPISIAQGVLSVSQTVQGVLEISLWTLFFYILSRILWNKGLRKYGAYGG